MKKYVLGFAFSENGEDVVLIEKQKPDWQKDKLNGVGGKVEPNEHFKNAMVREFAEETGVHTSILEWDLFAVLHGTNYVMQCYRIFTDEIYRAVTMEGETIYRLGYSTAIASDKLISSLKVLLPMAADKKFTLVTIEHEGTD